MPKVKKTQFAILGILYVSPMSGYDIKKYIEKSIGYFWAENYGAIYPTLNQMHKGGLVTKHEQINNHGPNSKIYSITQLGQHTLLIWLNKKVESERIRDELLLKLFFGNLISIDENINHIKEEKNQKQELLQQLITIENKLRTLIHQNDSRKQELSYKLMTVLRGKYEVMADIKWCDECLSMLSDNNND